MYAELVTTLCLLHVDPGACAVEVNEQVAYMEREGWDELKIIDRLTMHMMSLSKTCELYPHPASGREPNPNVFADVEAIEESAKGDACVSEEEAAERMHGRSLFPEDF